MLEEEELLEHASETGYRLCSRQGWVAGAGVSAGADADDDSWKSTFSATFDPNDPNQLYLCSQNGQLKVVDASNVQAAREYHVLFKRFTAHAAAATTPAATADRGKPITSHWDKMVLIPNKPGELLFLLGVSKTLLYTCIPGYPCAYPPEPMLARTTRGDSPDFIYGTAVLELYQHTCRVTSLAVRYASVDAPDHTCA